MSSKDTGVLYLNYGETCVLRMLLSIYSLRKYYDGRIILKQPKEGEKFFDKIVDQVKRYGVEVDTYDKPKICRRNTGYTIKPQIIHSSPLKHTLFVDSDTLFRDDPTELLKMIKDHGTILTLFENWISSGSKMRKRVKTFKGFISDEQLKEALNDKPAVNTGVMGFTKGISDNFMYEWIGTTFLRKCEFIVDEVACQVMFFKHKVKLADVCWNSSCRYGNFAKAKIVHYHGRKHVRTEWKSSRYWWATYANALEDSKLSKKELEFWFYKDRKCNKFMKEYGNLNHLSSIRQEFNGEFK